ncbi:ABC transporter substrate-binding protein [Iamia sp.]|uniref:ABC transporter substrate-binding protein n=1 Tax=Iamia sp. TaxID=2722710 RepID=UPI002CD88487|nr:ABC transporter substrate-binding protein [Iamia sp.]HXH56794.1 ABC transporter substrate-binding protein [Iamia sp.]
MNRSVNRGLLALLATLLLVTSACTSRDEDSSESTGGEGEGGSAEGIETEDCLTDPASEIEGDTIKLVSSYPQSGLTAAFAEIARGWAAYFDQVNADGGVEIAGNTYQIEFEDADDEYNPQQTASNIEELVGQEGTDAFAAFSVVGTANNLNVRSFLDERCVPNLLAATGSPAWGNPEFPWTIGSSLTPYTLEAHAFADYLEENQPDAQVAMLRQADDFGDAYEQGFRNAIEGTDIELVAVEEYPVAATDVGAQITSLANSGADAFFNGGTLLACPSGLTAAQSEGWEATTWVSGTCISKTLMGIAGAAGDDVISLTNLKDPQNPKYAEDEAMVAFMEAVEQYRPNFKGRELDLENGIVGYGWTQADLLIQSMEAAEAPTRLAIMEAVRNMDGLESGLLIEGVSISTSGEEDPYMGETFSLIQYDAAEQYFEELGELIDLEGQTRELTPDELIAG